MSAPRFFQTPFRYLRYVSHEKPAIFYSFIMGSMGPVILVAAPPIRYRLGDGPRPPIPMTYPSNNLNSLHMRIILNIGVTNFILQYHLARGKYLKGTMIEKSLTERKERVGVGNGSISSHPPFQKPYQAIATIPRNEGSEKCFWPARTGVS